jgi:hypothetical protein
VYLIDTPIPNATEEFVDGYWTGTLKEHRPLNLL